MRIASYLQDKLETALLQYMFQHNLSLLTVLIDIERQIVHFGLQRVPNGSSWKLKKFANALQTLTKYVVDFMCAASISWHDFCDSLLHNLNNIKHQGYKLVKQGDDWVVQQAGSNANVIVIPEADMKAAVRDGHRDALFAKYFNGIPANIGSFIAGGSEGDVYDFGNKVIKIGSTWMPYGTVVYCNIRNIVKGIHTVLDNKASCTSMVYDFELLGKFQVATAKVKPEVYFAYYIVCEKLLPVHWGSCLHVRVSDVDKDAPSSMQGSDIIDGVLRWDNKKCWEEIKRVDVAMFKRLQQFKAGKDNLSFDFSDCHTGNIMQNAQGVLKLIDFGTFD